MNVIEVDEKNFQAEVMEATVPVLIVAYSPTCGPCQQMVPVLKELDQELHGLAKIVRFDATAITALSGAYRISAFPTFIVFRDGRQVARLVGVRSKEKLKAALGV